MKHLRFLVVVLALSAGCAKAPPTLSPVGVAAFHATQVVHVLDLVRDTAIAAEAQTPKIISTNSTRAIVQWHRAAVSTINAVPSGWEPTVLAGLDNVLATLSDSERAAIAPYVALAKTIIQETQR